MDQTAVNEYQVGDNGIHRQSINCWHTKDPSSINLENVVFDSLLIPLYPLLIPDPYSHEITIKAELNLTRDV